MLPLLQQILVTHMKHHTDLDQNSYCDDPLSYEPTVNRRETNTFRKCFWLLVPSFAEQAIQPNTLKRRHLKSHLKPLSPLTCYTMICVLTLTFEGCTQCLTHILRPFMQLCRMTRKPVAPRDPQLFLLKGTLIDWWHQGNGGGLWVFCAVAWQMRSKHTAVCFMMPLTPLFNTDHVTRIIKCILITTTCHSPF